jgi:hypothetical protein
MKLQDLNRSFAKVLAAVAIAFTISSAAQATGVGQGWLFLCHAARVRTDDKSGL